jgi:hypothetical protein
MSISRDSRVENLLRGQARIIRAARHIVHESYQVVLMSCNDSETIVKLLTDNVFDYRYDDGVSRGGRMANVIDRFNEYRKERKHIRDVLSLDNQNFW